MTTRAGDLMVLLLRGINVGRANRVAMAPLREVLERLGGRDVATYLQSGNVVLRWPGRPEELAAAARSALATELDLPVDVAVRTADELATVVAGNPFPDPDPLLLHAAFLVGPPDPQLLAALEPDGWAPDRVALGTGVLYLRYADRGSVRAGPLGRRPPRVGTPLTARNWRTVLALHDLLLPA